MFKKIILASFILATPAYAQQPDIVFLQRALGAIQTQRNAALDAQAIAEAKASGSADELVKANNKIKELEDKLNSPKEDNSKN